MTCRCAVLFAATMSAALVGRGTQESFSSGQNIAPVYEGWEQGADGSFTLVFGYFNRNWEEEIDLPVGADNTIDPADPIRGSRHILFPGAIASSSAFM